MAKPLSIVRGPIWPVRAKSKPDSRDAGAHVRKVLSVEDTLKMIALGLQRLGASVDQVSSTGTEEESDND